MPKPRILVIGEALIDIVREAGGTSVEHVGGSPANVAVGLARLDHKVRLATALGRDERGQRIADHLRRHGVKVTRSSFTAARTSTAQATFDSNRNATYQFALHWDLAPVKAGKRTTHVHAGSLATVLPPGAARARAALSAKHAEATISYDPNIRPGIMGDLEQVRAGVEDLLAVVDVVKASTEDIESLYPGHEPTAVIDRWLSLGPSLAVLTRGSQGVAYRTSTSDLVSLPAPAVEVVDTVGAGDSFMAGLISGLLHLRFLGGLTARAHLAGASSDDVRPAIERGLATSAVTVGHPGAYAPSLDEL